MLPLRKPVLLSAVTLARPPSHPQGGKGSFFNRQIECVLAKEGVIDKKTFS
jgi:hypothetical protein